MLMRHLIASDGIPEMKESEFNAVVESAKERLPGIGQKLIDQVESILKVRQKVAQAVGAGTSPIKQKNRMLTDFSQLARPAAATAQNPFALHLESLLPRGFLKQTTFDQLAHLPRYLKALSLRIERSKNNANKDRDRAQQIEPYLQKLDQLTTKPDLPTAAKTELAQFQWMVREYQVSIFAQELGTALPVSAKRLDQQFQRVREEGG
jgi:ATP-dependent helicase HrpA